ncbi:hypothetical protein OS493_022507 [Desmophyllum pertusum]|uniref:Uncharacterized protein n=1 Tax=Desmophyllum pertusum TaxID=174260 RepID=A0A9X0CYU5_9CNID|nr:hypothetical protein OS493_022507 [Desmophyllum pertusum]
MLDKATVATPLREYRGSTGALSDLEESWKVAFTQMTSTRRCESGSRQHLRERRQACAERVWLGGIHFAALYKL